MRRRTRLGELGLAATLAAVLVGLFWPEPVGVDVAAAKHGRLVDSVAAEGMVRVRQLYVVAAPLAGTLGRISLEPGDAVTAGETVALLHPALPAFLDERDETSLRAAIDAAAAAAELAEARITAAEARLEFAAAEWRRVEYLAARGVEAVQDHDRARTDLADRRAELAAAEANQRAALHLSEQLRARLLQPSATAVADATLRVTAPASGRVMQVLKDSETVVPPGAPLLTLGDARDIEVAVELPSDQAVGLRPGLPATVERWGGSPLPARLTRIEPGGRTQLSLLGFEEQRVTVVLELLTPASTHAGLAHGFRVDVRIDRGQGDGLKIPLGALVRHAGGWAVYVVADEHARLRPLHLGRHTASEAEVLDGLAAGERVVVHPGEYVTDGVAVRVR